ncbi:hypothetical protein FBU59_002749 [Linderina macrospora]|uniref:Uncharacterized protein n=1 Tax=Linderina macrospora TaxID=4868 RepID=A0ACC1JA68_9FUNG|nr:hypothetical protein FBU59_002749 [Linderina macrospora]
MLDVGDQIKFGVSSRTWCLGTTDAEFCEQREEAKHQEMQRKILEHAQQTENLGVASQAVRQGNRQQMTLDEDDIEQAHTDSGNPVRADWTGSDQAWYRRNPIGSLQIVLDEHGQDYDPEVLGGDPEDDDSDDDEATKRNRKPGQTTVRIALPFIDDHGKPLYGIGQATKQHEAERRACLDALEELDKRSYLSDPRELRQRASKSKKQPLDNSDEDDDEFYDRTRTTKNQHKAQVSEVETFETLTDKHRVVCTEVVEIEQQLKEMLAGEGNSGDAADELDAYMNALTHKEEQQQQKLLEMKLGELKKEMERLITLIKIVAPDHQPQPGPKRKPQPRPEPKVPLTKLVHAPPASSAMPPPAMPAKRPAADIKQKETPKQRKIVAGPTLPPPMAPAKKQDDSVWQAPAGQTGDGKTALNDKFGY